MIRKVPITNSVLSVTLLLLLYTKPTVYGLTVCTSTNPWKLSTTADSYIFCEDNEYCCGTYNDKCCGSSVRPNPAMEIIGFLIFLFFIICCPVMCYRCCCARTASRGHIYSPAPGTTTSVAVTLPPQQMPQVPYPTVVPYPQQTPYPPQYPTNPYYGMPPPAYGVAIQAGTQQASAPPSAPYPS